MNQRTDIEQLEAKIYQWRSAGLDKKKEHLKLSSEEALLLIEDLTLKTVQNTEIEHLNKEIIETRDKYRELYNSYPEGYLALDENCGIKEANGIITQLLETENAELLKMNLIQFIPPDFHGDFKAFYDNLLQTGARQTRELKLKNQSGTIFNARLSGIASVDSKKKTVLCRLYVTAIKDSPDTIAPPETMKVEVDEELKESIRRQLYSILKPKCLV
jgi:PAS domain S-box-containing protein